MLFKMSLIKLVLFCCLLGYGSAWTQTRDVNSCYVRPSVCTSNNEDIKKIREVLENSISTSLEMISTSLQELVAQNQLPTEAPTEITTNPPTTEPPPPLGSFENPASSCKDIPQERPSGEYWIQTNSSDSPVQVYCDMSPRNCSCDNTGGWTRVANLDMTDPSQQCPDGFRQVNRTSAPLRTCGRPGPAGCVSTTYPSHGIEYSRVCGKLIGYQDSSPSAFELYFYNRNLTIDDLYIEGISLTHGQSPRQHIWTFANALDEIRSQEWVCPCTRTDLTYTGVVPPFVGQDYFCETGSRNAAELNTFYANDPLWDGHGCGVNSACCEFNNPPWFCKQLPQATTDDIELRLCADQAINDEDSPLEIVEIYIR